MFTGFEKGAFTLDKIKISYVKAGNGPPVLLLHGFPQTKAMWAKVAETLCQDFTVICADLRGYGDSSKPRCRADHSNYAFREMANDQIKLMQSLGYETFHLVGHDRGARTAFRLALDHPHMVQTLTVMDIVPTWTMFMDVDMHSAKGYWHWYFLSQPFPLPETLIKPDPDFFFENSLTGFGAARISDFDSKQMAIYRKAWRKPSTIHGMCSDYRAAATIDLEHDKADLRRKISCPALVMYGAKGNLAKWFDLAEVWADRLENMRVAPIESGHFLVDEKPEATTDILHSFLAKNS